MKPFLIIFIVAVLLTVSSGALAQTPTPYPTPTPSVVHGESGDYVVTPEISYGEAGCIIGFVLLAGLQLFMIVLEVVRWFRQ